MIILKAKYRNDPEKIHFECMSECNFLYTYYTDIYNKIRKDEIDLSILNKFLNVLQQIEEGKINQHEGSFLVGSLLKELYIDSALKKSEKLEQIYGGNNENNYTEPIEITWKQYKSIKKNINQ